MTNLSPQQRGKYLKQARRAGLTWKKLTSKDCAGPNCLPLAQATQAIRDAYQGMLDSEVKRLAAATAEKKLAKAAKQVANIAKKTENKTHKKSLKSAVKKLVQAEKQVQPSAKKTHGKRVGKAIVVPTAAASRPRRHPKK